MRYICTLSDYNYAPFGFALYESLLRYSNEFKIYYLCLDEKIYDKIKSSNLKNIEPIKISDLVAENQDLQSYKTKEYREFAWMLASYFCDYILKSKPVDEILYIDADIYFYNNINLFYDEIGKKSVGIIRHRHISEHQSSRDGKYNVGLVYFKNNEVGKKCCNWWKDAVINRKYPELSTCYDQKYLEGFFLYFDKNEICVVDKNFAHGAPWHYRLYDWSKFDNNIVLWQGQEQTFLFNHFSRFKFDFINNRYSFCGNNYLDHTLNLKIFENEHVKKLYDNYFEILKNIKNIYKL